MISNSTIYTDRAAPDPGCDWRSRAACRDADPELFFPVAESGPERDRQVEAAKQVCAGCPVRAECLSEALARIPYGICGGLTEHERSRLRITARTTSGAGEGSAGGHRAPLRVSQHIDSQAGTRGPEGARA